MRPGATRSRTVLAALIADHRLPDAGAEVTRRSLESQAQASMQLPNHVDRERPAPIQDLGHVSSAAEVRLQIPLREAAALHVVEQGIDRAGWLDRRFVLRFVSLDKGREDLQSVAG